MATLRGFDVPIDLSGAILPDADADIVAATASEVRVRDPDGDLYVFEGDFALAAGVPVGGTVTGLRVVDGAGRPVVTASDFSIAAGSLLQLIEAGDVDGFRALVLDGADDLRGSTADDVLLGEGGPDTIDGRGGADRLSGGPGADVLRGGGGADEIDGGPGADRMIGGPGRDLYLVDDPGDRVVETASGGLDLVGSALASYQLPANVEAGGLDAGGLDLIGNGLDNLLIGNELDNQIWGGAGSDLIEGGPGDDTLTGGGGDDSLAGNAGDDLLRGGAGGDELFGDAGADRLFGGRGPDLILGGEGDDRLFGGRGRDLLDAEGGANEATGGPGRDHFQFDPALVDDITKVTDFEIGADGDLLTLFGDLSGLERVEVILGDVDDGTRVVFSLISPDQSVLTFPAADLMGVSGVSSADVVALNANEYAIVPAS